MNAKMLINKDVKNMVKNILLGNVNFVVGRLIGFVGVQLIFVSLVILGKIEVIMLHQNLKMNCLNATQKIAL